MLFGKYIEIIAHMKTYYVNHTQKIVTPCHALHRQYDVGEWGSGCAKYSRIMAALYNSTGLCRSASAQPCGIICQYRNLLLFDD